MSSVEHQRGWETKSDIVQFGSPVTAHILTTLSPPAPPPGLWVPSVKKLSKIFEAKLFESSFEFNTTNKHVDSSS